MSAIALFGLLFTAGEAARGQVLMAEYQVKALFLLNFTKYVEWPSASFADTNAPLFIGFYGEDKFGDALKKTFEGKTISGRRIITQPIEKDGETGKCHILFISDSERKRHPCVITSVMKNAEAKQLLRKSIRPARPHRT